MLVFALAAFTLLADPASVVVVPLDRSVELRATPSPRVIIGRGPFTMGASADDVRQARALCVDELRGEGALMLELSPRCGARFETEAPMARVQIASFALDRTEVTVAAYAGCVRAGACRALATADPRGGSRPVERVSFDEAEDFCRWQGGRLPSEAEWEKAARGPSPRIWPWGDEWLERRANHGRAERLAPGASLPGNEDTVDASDGFAAAAPVGSFPGGASPYGLLDMAGNVWEWTSGYFAREPPQASEHVDPQGPPFASERTIRGGGYRSPPSDLRVTRRMGMLPDDRQPGVGFRCAYDLPRAAPEAAPRP